MVTKFGVRVIFHLNCTRERKYAANPLSSYFFTVYRSQRILDKIDVVTEKNLLAELISKNFSAAYAVSKRKADVILNSADLKVHGESVYHMMQEILGKHVFPLNSS